jgi:hypothetical protein
MMPEQRQQNDDRQRDAKQPQESPSSETHVILLTTGRGRPRCWKTPSEAVRSQVLTLSSPPSAAATQKRRPKPPFGVQLL